MCIGFLNRPGASRVSETLVDGPVEIDDVSKIGAWHRRPNAPSFFQASSEVLLL